MPHISLVPHTFSMDELLSDLDISIQEANIFFQVKSN